MKRTAIISLVLLAMACKSKTTESDATEPGTYDTSAPTETDDGSQADVNVDKRIADLCNLQTPNFSFNSTKLSKQAKQVLDELATCFVSGPAKDHNLRLVGHADPRGTEEYNFGLGQKRAGKVAQYLGSRGVGKQRIETSSRGELEATGSDDEGWARDRRVEILLAD